MIEDDKIARDLKAIREVVDTDTSGADIDSVVECGKKLASMAGLSAQCMGAAKKRLENARLKALKSLMADKLQPSVMLKLVEATCGEELALYDYADRINAAISHQLDYYRTVISLYKTELENSLKQPK
jgi:hypothetical protein